MCPYFVSSPEPGSLFCCDSQALLGAPTIPTPEERLDLCTTGGHAACPIYIWASRIGQIESELGVGD
jgi:hypothetical protein